MTTHDTKREKVPKEPDRARPRPTSGAESPPIDTDSGGAEAYDEFFGTPALADDQEEQESPGCPFEGIDHNPLEHIEDDPDPFEGDAGDPPAAPSLPFTAYPPKRELYEAAFRAAYKYPDALMLVMQGVRKGLKRGKEAAQRAGGQDR
ncbi:hypothetical protein [Salinibacter ruber]|uniref:hypothetical protein n=1 Tax=Salinibacter ruber TaxID=146919 RepID=UPI0021683B02|nr:hypothetical protein [Salinibacter ruber]MCS4119614.1 hypothetical protein [Salinibacter ruber]